MIFIESSATPQGQAQSLRQHLSQLGQDFRSKLGRLQTLWHGKHPALTLLNISDGHLMRVDADAKGGLLGEPARLPIECYSAADLPTAVGSALKLGPRPGSRVWVLYDGLPNHSVSIPTAQILGLNGEPLAQTLLFELDQIASVPVANQRLSYALLNQTETQSLFWVNHIPKPLLAQLQKAAHQHGCRLGGLLHPGGLPHPLAPDFVEKDWARLEIWPDMLIGLYRHGQDKLRGWMVQSNAKALRIQTEVERWKTSLGVDAHLETLGRGAVLDLLPKRAVPIHLDGDDSLRYWLASWTEILAQGQPTDIPVLRPPEDPMQERWIMAGGAAAALAICLLHAGVQLYRAHAQQADLRFLKGSESQIMAVETEIKKYRDQIDQLKKKLEPVKNGQAAQTPTVLAALRQRPTLLLRELSANATDGLVIEEIRSKPDALIVKGVSLDAVAANDLGAALAMRLHGLGWRVEPPKKKDLALSTDGGPWEFEIALVDSGLVGFAQAERLPREAMR